MRTLYDRYNSLKHQIREVEGLLAAYRQQVTVLPQAESSKLQWSTKDKGRCCRHSAPGLFVICALPQSLQYVFCISSHERGRLMHQPSHHNRFDLPYLSSSGVPARRWLGVFMRSARGCRSIPLKGFVASPALLFCLHSISLLIFIFSTPRSCSTRPPRALTRPLQGAGGQKPAQPRRQRRPPTTHPASAPLAPAVPAAPPRRQPSGQAPPAPRPRRRWRRRPPGAAR